MIKIRLHEDYITHYPIGGVKPTFEEAAVKYMSNLTNWGCSRRRRIGNVIEVDLATNVSIDMVDFAYLMTRIDGDVINFKPYLGIDDLQSLVPEYLPNAYKTVILDDSDPENISTTSELKTWIEWIKPNYTINEVNGVSWILSYSGTDKATSLSGDILWRLETEENGVDVDTAIPLVEE